MKFHQLVDKIQNSLPVSHETKLNLLLKAYGVFKIPLLLFTNPKIVSSTDNRSEVKIELNYRTKNHLKVMYFGALVIGAELSIALKAVERIAKSKKKIDFLFKDFKIEFLKRADGDVHFICDEVHKVESLIQKSLETPERLEEHFIGHAIVPSKGSEPILKYELTLSLKNRSFKRSEA